MKTELDPDVQNDSLPGQLTFFPELESDPAPRIRLQNPISPPEFSQLEQWKISILICDVLLRFDGAMPERWLYDIMVGGGYFNHFIYTDACGALTEHGAAEIVQDEAGENVCVLTAVGKANVKRLRLYVPKVFRDQVHLTALRYIARQRALRDLQITFEPDGDACRLCLRCMDHGTEMLFLRISAPSQAHAEELSERILRNPSRFFGSILDLAMTNEEEPFDLADN